MTNQRKLDYNDFLRVGGTQCAWCGRTTEQRYLFPIMFSAKGKKAQQLHIVCFECLARNNVPKEISHLDLPWYDGRKRVNEKAFTVSVSRTGFDK